ncbi:MAG: DUF3575 domain-containing protein [Rikenellaceae bacterium]
MKRIKIIGVLALLCWNISAHAQENKAWVDVFFPQGEHTIDTAYAINGFMLDRLEDQLTTLTADSTKTINRITISSYTSPEGGMSLNNKLAEDRAQSLYDYVKGLEIEEIESLIEVNSHGIAWDHLRWLVSLSEISSKEEVLRIIDEVPEETWEQSDASEWLTLTDSRNKHLMDLEYGRPYQFMMDSIYPALRKSSLITIYYQDVEEAEQEPEPVVEEPAEEPTRAEEAPAEGEEEIKALFAVKTNLLYDIATVLNVELEVPIGQRWSIAGEWVFPWWTSCGSKSNSWQSGESSHRNTLQLLNGNIEGKYWFGDRTDRLQLTGWHLGLYVGGGLYDLERNAEGYQGDFFLAAGLSGGYAHTILNRCVRDGKLRLEYSLAIGYLETNYDKYNEHWGIDNTWHTIRQESGKYSWFGPTRARVSLVWMFNRKVNKEE